MTKGEPTFEELMPELGKALKDTEQLQVQNEKLRHQLDKILSEIQPSIPDSTTHSYEDITRWYRATLGGIIQAIKNQISATDTAAVPTATSQPSKR